MARENPFAELNVEVSTMMRKDRLIPIICMLILIQSSLVATAAEPGYTMDQANALTYSPQVRQSNYAVEVKNIPPYTPVNMSARPSPPSPSNDTLLEKLIALNMTTRTVTVNFNLTSNDIFLAIDGASQSSTYHVDYTVKFPNDTQATKIRTVANSPLHHEVLNPPIGTWHIIAYLVEEAETNAFIQAVAYQNGTRLVTGLEKTEINLMPGQAVYLKIPLSSATDWFYAYINRISEGPGDIQILMRSPGAFGTFYRNTQTTLDEFFAGKSNPIGVYLLSITGSDRVDFFIEITKPRGVKQKLDLDKGIAVRARYTFDFELLNLTIAQSKEWLVLEGAVTSHGMRARFQVIYPDMTLSLPEYSEDPSQFIEKWFTKPAVGKYLLAILANKDTVVTAKITSISSVEFIGGGALNREYHFTQSGQTVYLNLSSFKGYFLFTGTTLSSANIRYVFYDPNLNVVWPWNWGPGQGTFIRLIVPTEEFYVLKIQGQTDCASIIHIRTAGLEDYSIGTPDASNYFSRFQGDIITANLTLRTDSDYFFQFAGVISQNVYVALFDSNYDEKWSQTFSYVYQSEFHQWRRGYESLPSGQWLQVVLSLDAQSTSSKKVIEISSLQYGDESKNLMTPYQLIETVDWSNLWQMRIYKVYIDQHTWFGTVSQMLSLNETYQHHPAASIWIYDSSLQIVTLQSLYQYNMFSYNMWENPKKGVWTAVVIGFRESPVDPLKLSVSFVGEADFHRNWPSNLTGSTSGFQAIANDRTYLIEIVSNSTISPNSFAFNAINQEILYGVSDQKGTKGFSVVSIPKLLAQGPFSVYVDNYPQNGVLSVENSTHTKVFFSYEHSVHQVKIIYAVPGQVRLTVKSNPALIGLPNPTFGDHWYNGSQEVTATVDKISAETNGKRYLCLGWTGSGSVPLSGTSTATTFRLYQHSSITWNWGLQCRLNVTTKPANLYPQPTVSTEPARPPSPWYDQLTIVFLTAQPVTGYTFSFWEIDGVRQTSDSVILTMTEPHVAIANYEIGKGHLNIYVKDKKTGRALSGVTVKSLLQPEGQYPLNSTTDNYGVASFYYIDAGHYKIEVSKAGYIKDSLEINVTRDETSTGTINLYPIDQTKGVLKVYVQGTNGSALKNINVISTNQPNGQTALNGTTDDSGLALFEQILIGSYTIKATKDGYIPAQKYLTLKSDEVNTVTIALMKLNETGNLKIQVNDNDNIPLSGARVASTSQPELQIPISGTTNSSGLLEFVYLAPGNYHFTITKDGYRSAAAAANVVAQKTTNVTVKLEPDKTKPVVSVSISPENPDSEQSIIFTVTAADDINGSGIAQIELYVDDTLIVFWNEEGTFEHYEGPYPLGNHTYYAKAIDKAGNEARDPLVGNKMFTVTPAPPRPQGLPLWLWLSIASVATLTIAGTALITRKIYNRRRLIQAKHPNR